MHGREAYLRPVKTGTRTSGNDEDEQDSFRKIKSKWAWNRAVSFYVNDEISVLKMSVFKQVADVLCRCPRNGDADAEDTGITFESTFRHGSTVCIYDVALINNDRAAERVVMLESQLSLKPHMPTIHELGDVSE